MSGKPAAPRAASRLRNKLLLAISDSRTPVALMMGGHVSYANSAFTEKYGDCNDKTFADFFSSEHLEQLNWLMSGSRGEADKIVLPFKEGTDNVHAGEDVMVQIWPLDDEFCLLSLQTDYSVRRLADLDELTHLPNRRKAMMLMDIGKARTSRSSGFCLALGDIDHFKSINDTYGHDVGDMVLQRVAQEMTSLLRGGDWVARWGGEEFLIFTGDSDVVTGMQPVERIRQKLQEMTFEGLADLKVTMSFGLASSEGKQSIHALINKSDNLLYEAKHNGRNRIEFETKSDTVWVAGNIRKTISEGDLQAQQLPVHDWDNNTVVRQIIPYLRGRKYAETEKMLFSASRLREQVMIDYALMKASADNLSPAGEAPSFFPLYENLCVEREAEVLDFFQRFPHLYIGINAHAPLPDKTMQAIMALKRQIIVFNYDMSKAPSYLMGLAGLGGIVFSNTQGVDRMLALLKGGDIRCYAQLPAQAPKDEKEKLRRQGFDGWQEMPSADMIL